MKKRIVITGPESSGKSVLTEHLSQAFGVPAALEFARLYLEENGPDYDYDRLLDISRGHLAYQRQRVDPEMPLGLFDTDLINYRIWCDVVFGQCHREILETMRAETGHVYLLCFPDLPWQDDPLRECPDQEERVRLFERHREEIIRLGRPYIEIRGTGEIRFRRAEEAFMTLIAG